MIFQPFVRAVTGFFEKRTSEDGTYNIGYLYRRLYPYFSRYKFRVLAALVITVPIGALDGAIAFSLKPYVDTIQVNASVQSVSYVPFIIVGFTFLQGLLNYFSIYLNGWLGGKIMSDLRRDLFEKLQTMEVRYFDRITSGAVIQAYFQDPMSINTNILNNTKQMLTRLSSAGFLMGVLVMTSWKLSIIAISVLAFIVYPSTRIRKIIKELARKTQAVSGNILSFYTESVGGIRVIYGFNMPKVRLKQFDHHQDNLFKTTIKYTQAQGWLTPSMHIIASIGIGLIIWQGSLMVVQKELTSGGFVSFIAAMLMLYNPMKNMGNSIMTAQMSMLAAGRIFYTLDQTPGIEDKPTAKILTGIERDIVFENVGFTYDYDIREEGFILKEFNLRFNKGETTAIVGVSGSGKSTVANIIPRFYDVYHGSVKIDGVDIRDFTMDSLRRQIAIVLQDNFMFDGTIRENLLVGNPNASEEQLWEALDKAYLKDFVAEQYRVLEEPIGERGIMLSGGQRQRLAIARAILKDAPIVILDEATSALDSQAEIIVQKAMESLMENRTVIVIAHRLSTIRYADRIVVLESGRVVEQGVHEDLLAANGAYAMLHRMQYNPEAREQIEKRPVMTV